MVFTKRISIERYKGDIAEDCAGLIEGESEDGERWIIYMDAAGRPHVFWPKRGEDGEVCGVPILMTGPVTPSQSLNKLKEILDSSDDPVAVVTRLRAAVEAAEQRIAEEDTPAGGKPIE